MTVVKAIKLAMNVPRFILLCANLFFLFFSSVVEQIFTHLYTELFPEMRYAFREAVRCMNPDYKNNMLCCRAIG